MIRQLMTTVIDVLWSSYRIIHYSTSSYGSQIIYNGQDSYVKDDAIRDWTSDRTHLPISLLPVEVSIFRFTILSVRYCDVYYNGHSIHSGNVNL